MSTTTNEAETATEMSCSRCERGIDVCAFCDRSGCAVAVCYGCMIEALDQAAPRSSEHGRPT